MMLRDTIQYACGSVVGRDHLMCGKVLVGKNCQDAVSISQSQDCLVAIVCDGCGSGQHSEVGAQLAAKMLSKAILGRFTRHGCLNLELLNAAKDDVLAQIRVLALQMGESLSAVVTDYFLFTVVGLAVTEESATVFSIGDGVHGGETQDGRLDFHVIGPFPGNAPPYPAYRLVKSSVAQELLDFQIVAQYAPWSKPVFIGSDGLRDLWNVCEFMIPGTSEPVGGLWQFWENDAYFANSDALPRKLRRINSWTAKLDAAGRIQREAGLLPDDTTLVVVRRRPQA
jgi:hypothetical protein